MSELYMASWELPELVEAATRTRDAETALSAVKRLGEIAETCNSDWVLGVHSRSRALVSSGLASDGEYRQAIEILGRTSARPDLARAHLLYGEWLRRENRRIEARAQLRIAHDMLAKMGMDGFAARARRELQATGEAVRKRTPETQNDLTPQEALIARLASEGQTNSEIGAHLFLSANTVDYHLRKIFSKLGIRSRIQLGAALAKLKPGTL
jgi:DNA-binding CsgD family transcriptional regulator